MRKIIIEGGRPLRGIINASGSKNAVLPIIAASLLTDGISIIEGAPRLSDVHTMCATLEYMGIGCFFSDNELRIDPKGLQKLDAPAEFVRRMRASFLLMGPLLVKRGHVKMSLPGGCAIGSRPIDLHLKGFEALGAEISMDGGSVSAKSKGLKGARIYLDFPSVGATENLMMAASAADGTTEIENAAAEPEIVDLANFLGAMGAKIKGAGTRVIRIEGVKELRPARHMVIPDRIEIGTFMAAAVISGGAVIINNVIEEHLKAISAKLVETGAAVIENYGSIKVAAGEKIRAANVTTLPYPGFPTDMQAQIMSLMALAEGVSEVNETVFENRFMHVDELIKMGADIVSDGHTATVRGVKRLYGAGVNATDLRAGSAMVIAALAAEGRTEISHIHHIERGYENLVEKLCALGANISIAED